ncbi:hypothetical protein EPUS_05769 [Endocarpon pusillum Z07020]|uniref:Uncharacterized protein n=1 Tax=Endocarpon pusillum (strain Z07020 / HMAS-L-300199) TaxID=1263415 RepID=U1G9N7_ENDPU|nr:uncharacterized protein EPUS_05769 [Endocarpon pusillum Z07020]ERF68708.1 hypothetical protein EPUS_05769 [Endocarpon pusillum Z07020]
MVQTRRQAAARPDSVLMTADQLPPLKTRRKPLCRDCPPRSMVAFVREEDFPKVERKDDERPRSRCTIPPSAGVEVLDCEGWSRGYENARRPGHGKNFRVCLHCARRNWDLFTWTRKPYSVDLCRRCSLTCRAGDRYPGDGRNECQCHILCIDRSVHLCYGCRQEQQQREYQRLGEWARLRMMHIHGKEDEPCNYNECTRISHYVDNDHHPFGESGCICPRNLDEGAKLETYDVNGRLDFGGMVRMCLHCRREVFVIRRFTYYPPEWS